MELGGVCAFITCHTVNSLSSIALLVASDAAEQQGCCSMPAGTSIGCRPLLNLMWRNIYNLIQRVDADNLVCIHVK